MPTVSGGNPKLRPEAGRTYTFGVVLTPRWIRGLSTSVTYWHYNVSSAIGALDSGYILGSCYGGTNPAMCGLINRSSDGQLSQVRAVNGNLGTTNTSGVDWDLDYRIRLSMVDTLTLSNNLQKLVSFDQQMSSGGDYYHFVNAIYWPSGKSNPRWRDYASVTWQHGPFSITYMANYTGGMRLSNAYNDYAYIYKGQGYNRDKMPAMVQQDISLGYRYNTWNFTGGVNNITDKAPPYFVDGATNTDASTYGSFVSGRNFWLQISKDF